MTPNATAAIFIAGATATVVALIFTSPGPAASVAVLTAMCTLSALGSIPKK